MEAGSMKGNNHVSSPEMDPSKPHLIPASPCLFDYANENNKIESGAISGAGIDNNTTSKSNQPQAVNPIMGLNSDLDMDPRKLRRVMSNRLSAQKSRQKKAQYLTNLEFQVRAFKAQIANLLLQVQFYENQKCWIILENEKLGCEMATLMKQILLREAEIEKNKFEVNALREVHTMQQEHLQALMSKNANASLEPMLNDQVSNYYQGNGEETSDLPPTQSQIWTDVQNEHETYLNLANYIGSVEISTHSALNPNLKK